jgi:hypothetical protein
MRMGVRERVAVSQSPFFREADQQEINIKKLAHMVTEAKSPRCDSIWV